MFAVRVSCRRAVTRDGRLRGRVLPDRQPNPQPAAADVDRLVAAAELLLDGHPTRVHRRVETLEFLPDGVSRRISVDVTPPPTAHGIPLAITFLTKGTVALSINVVSGGGRALPLLSRGESAEIAFTALMLSSIAADVVPSPEEEELLLAIAFERPSEAEAALGALTDREHRYADATEFLRLARVLTTNTPIFVVLDPEQGRQVVKLEMGVLPLTVITGSVRAWLRSRTSVLIELDAVPASESYHLQIVAPPAMELIGVRLGGRADSGSAQVTVHGRHANIALLDASPTRRAYVELNLAPLRAATESVIALAVLVAALLTGVAVAGEDSSLSTTATTLLLLVPAVLAGRAATSDAADVVTYARGLRVRALLVCVAALAGAAAVALAGASGGRLAIIAGAVLATGTAIVAIVDLVRRGQ